MQQTNLKKYKIPDRPGVYFFLKEKSILYIGKATSLRDRTKSYFSKDLIVTRGPRILDMVVQANKIDWQTTDSVLEALILEAELIKKYQPKYNIDEKDDKSWNYVCITQEDWPKIVLRRGKELKEKGRTDFAKIFGPYTNGGQLKEALKIIRRIFPYLDEKSVKKNNQKFYEQLGLVPTSGLKEYKNNIKNLTLFFQGKKKKILQNLKKEMMHCAKTKEFEKAGEIKKRIFALEHINDIALIKNEVSQIGTFSQVLGRSPLAHPDHSKKYQFTTHDRIEAYDVAHLSGKNTVGVMTVLENGLVQKNEYKKFIVRTQSGSNDTGALEEILSRRLRHAEWGMPNLLVVDGSIAQINVAKRVLSRYQLKIPVVSVVKDERHKAKAIVGDENIVQQYKKSILLANSEAHRFAINFYRTKSRKSMLT